MGQDLCQSLSPLPINCFNLGLLVNDVGSSGVFCFFKREQRSCDILPCVFQRGKKAHDMQGGSGLSSSVDIHDQYLHINMNELNLEFYVSITHCSVKQHCGVTSTNYPDWPPFLAEVFGVLNVITAMGEGDSASVLTRKDSLVPQGPVFRGLCRLRPVVSLGGGCLSAACWSSPEAV